MRGFSLISLLIAVVIAGIIAVVAYPSYRSDMLKSRRSDAKAALSQLSDQFGRCYDQYGSYDPSDARGCPPVTTDSSVSSPEGYYSVIALSLSSDRYKLEATPTGKGGQNDDATCHRFTLQQTGRTTAYSTDGSVTSGSCW